MTNFDRVKLVLDRLHAAASASNGNVDSDVSLRLPTLSTNYGNMLAPTRKPIDYSHAITHIAYAFRCLAPHANLLSRTLNEGKPLVLSSLRGQKQVVCVGGGPGSDILGVVRFLEQNGATGSQIGFTVLDVEPAWEQLNRAVSSTVTTVRHSVKYIKTDLAGGTPWATDWSFAPTADLYTFSFVLSEVWCYDGTGSVSGFLDRLFSSAKAGALFAYIDNGGAQFTPLIEAAINKRTDLVLIASHDETHMLIDNDEQVSALGDYPARFGQSPKLTGKVARRLWIKQA